MNPRLLIFLLLASLTSIAQSPFVEGSKGPQSDFLVSLLDADNGEAMKRARGWDDQRTSPCGHRFKPAQRFVDKFQEYREYLGKAARAAGLLNTVPAEPHELERFELSLRDSAIPKTRADEAWKAASVRHMQDAMEAKADALVSLMGLAYHAGHRYESIQPLVVAGASALDVAFLNAPEGSIEQERLSQVKSLRNSFEARLRPQDAGHFRIRVSSGVIAGQRIDNTRPAYPAYAKAKGIQGTVVLTVNVLHDGSTEIREVVSGPEELVSAAVDAAKQFRYCPYVLNGWPVIVESKIAINFQLK